MDGIVLLAKQPGITSFKSLNSVKKALNTKKVGHTGTLDSFAQGLMVVCVGKMTKLAGRITEFDKSYEAVIKFGEETDTLEYTGKIIKTAELPELKELEESVKKYTGVQMQKPPLFSAIHVDGKRASDLARQGNEAVIPERKIQVYSAQIMETLLNEENKVLACRINFSVSKGTYIRSLARDIAMDCGSAGHLIGLYRTKVGNFNITDAAGFSLMKDFNIQNCLSEVKKWKEIKEKVSEHNLFVKDENFTLMDEIIKKDTVSKIKYFDEATAAECGFESIHILEERFSKDFKNGKPVLKQWFREIIDKITSDKLLAVFSDKNDFLGLIEKKDFKHFKYIFVVN